jgi:hypothetical protein
MQRLWQMRCAGTETWLHRSTKGTGFVCLPRTIKHARRRAHLWCSRPTLVSWLKKNETNPKLEGTLLPAEPEDVLEADEMWSFVQEKWNKRWFWTVSAAALAKS